MPKPSPRDCRDQTAVLQRILDEQGKPTRNLTTEEEHFVAAMRLRIIYDAPFFLECFVQIDQEGHGLRPLYPLWESQVFVLDRLAELEAERSRTRHPDGLLVNVLKARQLGVSTLSEALLAHRLLTSTHTRGLVGADVEAQAGYLFRMVDRIYAHLPWFLKPGRLTFVKDREMVFENRSTLKTAWGLSMRGAMQEAGGTRGHIGRGQTFSSVHISELSTWQHPEQLDDGLLPAIPIDPRTLVIFESTAKGAGNWWHRQWLAAEEDSGRFTNLFIPWGIEPGKYRSPAPASWVASETTLAEARRAEIEWPKWIGRSITLTRDQLYWYESTRAYYEKKNELAKFKEEYATSPEDCFLYSGRSIFTIEQLEKIDAQARPLIDVWSCEPSYEIASLRRQSPEEPPDPRPRPPMAPKGAPGVEYPVPPGYGFRRLPPAEISKLKDLRAGVLAIWEYPRNRGRTRYVMPVDVGDGVGLDYSVIDIIRLPSVEEPAEQVAQYVSNTISPATLARVADAIGRLYSDVDGIEALAAVENNLGPGIATQTELQLHLGYTNFHVWEILDAGSQEARYTKRIGWATTPRTRPIILARLYEALTTEDPIAKVLDYRLNSPVTRQELRHLLIPDIPGARLGDAEAAPGHHDDAVMTSAIGFFVAYQQAGGETEPIAEQRRRRTLLQQYQQSVSQVPVIDFRNTDAEAGEGESDGDEVPVYFDERACDG